MRTTILFATALVALIACISAEVKADENQGCKKDRATYEAGRAPKAWVTSDNGHCAFMTAKTASSVEDAKRRALAFCQQHQGQNCRVVATQ